MLSLLKVNEVFVLAKDYSKLCDLSTRPTSVFFTNLFLWRLLADWPAVEPWEALYIYKAGLAAEESISSLRCALAMFNFFWIISFCGKFYHFTLCHQHHQVFLAVTWQLNRWPCHSLTHWLTQWATLDNFWPFLTIFDNFWQFLTIYDNFWQFWQFLTIFDNFDIFLQFWPFIQFLTILTI